VLGDPNSPPSLKRLAADTLSKVVPGFDKRQPEAELVAASRTFADHKARYFGAKANPDGSPATVPVWTWDAKDQKLVKNEEVPVGQADEYFGLRYARWALERKPEYEPAQVLILSLATERAVIRANFGDIAKTDPVVYRMLADAPTTVLMDLLDRALFEKRTALVLPLTQALGDRADKTPATGAGGRPSLFERALKYEDPRVELAAASALLRSPVPVAPHLRADVIRVLRRAAAIDQGVPDGAKGQVLIADPDRRRADHTALLLRGLGYDTEVYTTGREMLRRVARSSDFDLIVIDHHVPNPELVDLVGHLRADVNTARRPILVVASTDQPVPPSLDMLLLHLAGLIAATETEAVPMPPPYVPDPTRNTEEQAADRLTVQTRRDGVFRTAAADRLARLMRVVETTGLELTDAQKFVLNLRATQITYAVLAAEHPLTAESAPATFREVEALNRQIITQPPVPPYVRRVGTDQLMRIIERLEVDVSKVPEVRKRYDFIRSRVDPESLGLNVQRPRDFLIEAKVSRQVRHFPAVGVIPEPYSRVGFEDDVRAAFADPADAPRDPAEKKAGAKLAVEWLRKMATGEVTGFDVKPAEPELLAALRIDDLAEPAIEAVGQFPSAQAQQALVNVALTMTRPQPLRVKAADAAIRHIQLRGKLTPQTLVTAIVETAAREPDAEVRAKLFVLRGLLAPDPKAYLNDLRNYSPPLVPVAPKGPMPKAPDKGGDPKDPVPKVPDKGGDPKGPLPKVPDKGGEPNPKK
jgi:CheY-like chemotaxis protein